MISLLASSLIFLPTLNSAVKAQGQNQSSQGVQEKLDQLAQKFRGLVNSSGANTSLPNDGNLSERLQALADSAQFKNLSQQLSQQLSQLGINGSNLQSLKQEGAGPDFSGLVQKLQNLTNSR